MEIQLNKRLATVAAQGVADGVFCGISAGISVGHKKGRIRTLFHGGKTRFDPLGKGIKQTTLFDLASLTKPLCTVLCTLHLIDRGQLSWDEPLGIQFPRDKQKIEIRHLLQHCSGLPAYRPYYQQFSATQSSENTAEILSLIAKEPLEYTTGSTSLYSDLGFILLGDLIEQRSKMPLHQLFSEQISEPLGLENQLLFLPIRAQNISLRINAAATEHCNWRRSILQGEVHDEHCWLMGGVAGHAGLFGTVDAVMVLCELLLDVWKKKATHPAFRSELLWHAFQQKHPQSGWCLGFDTPTPGGSSSGKFFSPTSVGHLGFSGTSFWIDLEKEVVVVLLTNRIHPSRDNVKIRSYRPYFHDQLMEIIYRANK